MKRVAAMLALLSCGQAVQSKTEATVKYHLAFTAEPGASTRVIFPLPIDAAQNSVQTAITVSDGGTIAWVEQAEGLGAALDGHGTASADFFVKNLTGWPESDGPPAAVLSMHQPDAGPGEMYLRVNKGGFATVNVEFEYTATRECGLGCGGKRSWTFSGPVGLTLQRVSMNYVEEKR